MAVFFFAHRVIARFGTPDLGLLMEAALSSAGARGRGTCAQGYLGNYPDFIKAEFQVPEGYALICGMSLGSPSDHPIYSWEAEGLPDQT